MPKRENFRPKSERELLESRLARDLAMEKSGEPSVLPKEQVSKWPGWSYNAELGVMTHESGEYAMTKTANAKQRVLLELDEDGLLKEPKQRFTGPEDEVAREVERRLSAKRLQGQQRDPDSELEASKKWRETSEPEKKIQPQALFTHKDAPDLVIFKNQDGQYQLGEKDPENPSKIKVLEPPVVSHELLNVMKKGNKVAAEKKKENEKQTTLKSEKSLDEQRKVKNPKKKDYVKRMQENQAKTSAFDKSMSLTK